MKKIFFLLISFLSLNFSLIPLVVSAKQTDYYPSTSGAYTKVQLINTLGAGGPDENTSGEFFCAETSTAPTYGTPGDGSTYINAGIVFVDQNSKLLETCKRDGTVTSYGATN